MNVFTLPANDQSIYYLGQIFGYVGSVLPAQNAPLILGTMFKTFNTIVLVLGVIVMIYLVVMGLLMTAHEGKFLGDKWHGLWVPLRMIFGVVALYPTPTGYSALQIFLMWIVIQGVGAADTLWNTILGYINVIGSPYGNAAYSADTDGKLIVPPVMKQLFQSLSCQETQRIKASFQHGGQNYYYCAQSKPYCNSGNQFSAFDKNNNTYKMGPDGACGTLTYCSYSVCDPLDKANYMSCQIGNAACDGQRKALAAIVNTVLTPVATMLAMADYDYLNFSSEYARPASFIQSYCQSAKPPITNCCIKQQEGGKWVDCPGSSGRFKSFNDDSSGTIDYSNTSNDAIKDIYYPSMFKSYSGFIDTSVNYYNSYIIEAVNNLIAQKGTQDLKDWLKDAQKVGWMFAGAYYHSIAGKNDQNAKQASPTFSVTPAAPSEYRTNFKSADYLLKMIGEDESKGGGGGGGGGKGQQSKFEIPLLPISGILNDIKAALLNRLTDNLKMGESNKGDPISNVQAFGRSAMTLGADGYFAIIIVIAAVAALGGIVAVIFGSGGSLGFAQAVIAIVVYLLPFITLYFGSLMTIGVTLAIYVPFIPFIIFTLGAIGWLISVIEAMVAGPLIAVGIISPGGHDILGHAQPALMLMLNALLRPCLMLFGMIASMLLAKAGLYFLNSTFASILNSAGVIFGQESFTIVVPSAIAVFSYAAAYTALVVVILNKSFSLIHVVPDKVLEWIGGRSTGETGAEALQKVEGGISKAEGEVKQTHKEGVASAAEFIKNKKKQQE